MALRWTKGRSYRILDFDCENRPLEYKGDWTTGEVTAIGASWLGSREVDARLLTLNPDSAYDMLTWFRELYDEAGMVTGHYVHKHDLPLLSGAMLEHGLPKLTPKLVSDTHGDLPKKKDLSYSQEDLADMYDLAEKKFHPRWRESNRLTPRGIAETEARVVGDVKQHKALRVRLIAHGALKGPRMWTP